jgi:anti-sigma factor RsiW
MNPKSSSTTDQHQQLSLLLPWYVNHTLSADENQSVENHLKSCLLCRRELITLRRLASELKQDDDLTVAAHASLNALRSRIDFSEKRAPSGRVSVINVLTKKFAFSRFSIPVSLAACLILSVLIVGNTFELQQLNPFSNYVTLSNRHAAVIANKQIHVVFSPSVSLEQVNTLLNTVHANIVAGPNRAGAYTIDLTTGPDAQEFDKVVDFLRKQPGIVFAENAVQQ